MTKRSKVFGIGYAKTATSSLAKALAILEYKYIHDPYDVLPIFFPSELDKYHKDTSILEDNDAFVGVVCLIYKELDIAFPGSKFILTVRNEDRWLKSIRGHLHPKDKATRMDTSIPLQPFVREKMFNGHLWFDDEFSKDYLNAFRAHTHDVLDYFRDKDNLLVMDIEQGENWDKLCEFLQCDVPADPFPWKNRKSVWRTTRRYIKYWKQKLFNK